MNTTLPLFTARRFLSLVKNDVRHVFRDPVLTIIFIVPFLNLLFLRLGVPWLEGLLPGMEAYRPLILAAFCFMDAAFAAFLISFILLEEKDEQVHIALRVMPVAPGFFLLGRTTFLISMAFVFALLKILASGLVEMPLWIALLLSILVAASAPLLTLSVALFAKNKIEGMTWFKGLNAVLLLPILAFFISSPWKYLLGILPMSWIYQRFASVE